MPVEVWFIAALLAIICVTFMLFKRPIYECMFYGFVLMVILTANFSGGFSGFMLSVKDAFVDNVVKTSTDTLFFSIIGFLVLAKILDATKAMDSIVDILVSVLGRFKGGAAYIAVVGSTFMGALSGSGAGNVATTGVFTIPAMKKSGIPAHLAANIESSCSTMGNMIPPAGVILTALSAYNAYRISLNQPEMAQSVFWIACWGVALWFILQRIITVFIFCKIYKVKPMDKSELPSFRESLKKGWKNLLLPLIILLPFVLDSMFKTTFFKARLGAGASNLSSCLLLFTPGIASIYAILVNRKNLKGTNLFAVMKKSVSGIVPVGATIFFAYCISNLFSTTNIGPAIGEYIKGFNMPLVVLALLVPLFTAILGMVLPGSAQTKIFGGTIIAIFAAAGGNPLLAAVMLPVITGAMEGMTPPFALCMYTAMGIAGSKMKETTLNCLIWVGLHYLLAVVCLLGLLPIIGI